MLNSLSQNFLKIIDRIKGKSFITEENIDETIREIRIALLEADVGLSSIKSITEAIRVKAKGQEVLKTISPGQMIIKIIHDELIAILSNSPDEHLLNFPLARCNNFLMVGLQGSGKTTNSAKLALHLKKQHNKNVLLVSLDIYRPAAQEQLAIVAQKINVDSLPIIASESVIDITKRAIKFSQDKNYDIVIYDTAGRLHIDEGMLDELISVKKLIAPQEIIFVADALMGQDAVNIAKKFDEVINITGSIFTRMDGDQRGGAVLTIRHETQKPIKFLSVGEGLEELEQFYPERLVSRLLDMGDVVSLVEKAAQIIDQEQAEKAAARLKKGKFTLNDYVLQIQNLGKMGGFGSILSMLPGVGQLKQKLGEENLENTNIMLKKQLAIISSMTKNEKINPQIIKGSRRKRIALGAGTSINEVNKLLNQFDKIQTLMKKVAANPKGLMRGLMSKMF
jgi:signal recognition particle subunit SRP54